MKRILLFVSTLLLTATMSAEAQWVRNLTTGMSFTGGTAATAGIGAWGGYTPTYTTAACNVYASQYFGGSGANSGAPLDSTNQVAYTMVTIATGGDNNGAGQNVAGWVASPSFSVAMNGGANIDLTATTDRKLSISLRSTVAFTVEVALLDNGYQDIITSAKPTINILGDNAFHTYYVDFSTATVSGAINSVFNVSFIYNNSTPLSGRVFVDAFALGSATPLSVSNVSNLVSSSSLYPNPVSDMANLDLNLKSVSDVKVTLSDMMGKEVMTIAEGSFSSLNNAFSVANLNKGVYTVNYFINGSAAKSEMLMVK